MFLYVREPVQKKFPERYSSQTIFKYNKQYALIEKSTA
jgi:hypothetical protein